MIELIELVLWIGYGVAEWSLLLGYIRRVDSAQIYVKRLALTYFVAFSAIITIVVLLIRSYLL